jgi:uncharacterized protein
MIFFDSPMLRPYDGALMSNPPLPSQLDIRKLAVKGVEICAATPVSRLDRFVDLLANDGGSLKVDLHFYIDEERFRRVDGQITGNVDVFCQRCLEPMPLSIDTHFKLGIVWSEEDAERLPKHLEPLIVGEELVDLADIISEELILSLPFVSYHETAECQPLVVSSINEQAAVQTGPEAISVQASRDNPFTILQNITFDK